MRSLYIRLVVIISALSLLSGCLATTGCRNGRDYCPEQGPRQYIRAPDGWGGKYCLQNPMEC